MTGGPRRRRTSPSARASPSRSTGGALRPVGDGPVSDARYLDVVETPDGYRTFYEYPLPDGSHELRTESIVRR